MAKKNSSAAMVECKETPIDFSQMSFDEVANTAHRVEGLEVLEKEACIGRELLVVDARLNDNGRNGSFVSLTVAFRDGSRGVINDGSTGILKQVTAMAEENGGKLPLPIYCKGGLRKSQYTNDYGPCTTYYLAR